MKPTAIKTPGRVTFAVLLVGLAIAVWQPPASAQQGLGASRTSVAREVTVTVTPVKLASLEWEFKVVLDTHAGELTDEIASKSLLLVDGKARQPIAWEGTGSGGHHREGILRFAAPEGNVGNMELRLQRPGEPIPRVFRWELPTGR
ncbi:hypothetical protein WG902_20380 [Ramlibacter sp. PS3R-8]|uniref:hypothetical protein n=1 Tax=Ramlibacter sp. PS3R-8 TaxID=3133437 RepID=UPI0030A57B5B